MKCHSAEEESANFFASKAIFGTRDAAAAREREHTRSTLGASGFESGVSNPLLLCGETMDASTVVHGGEFIAVGDDVALGEHVISSHTTRYKFESSCCPGQDDAKEVGISSQYVRWNSDGEHGWIEHEPDP